MSEFWAVPMEELAQGQRVCAICGQRVCGDRPDPRETVDSTPQNSIDEPDEETR